MLMLRLGSPLLAVSTVHLLWPERLAAMALAEAQLRPPPLHPLLEATQCPHLSGALQQVGPVEHLQEQLAYPQQLQLVLKGLVLLAH